MALKINQTRTFKTTVSAIVENAGEELTGDFVATFKMPTISMRQSELEGTQKLMTLYAQLQSLGDDATQDEIKKISDEIEPIIEEQRGLLRKRIVKIEDLEVEDENGNALELTNEQLIDIVVDDLELSKFCNLAYGDAIEKKMTKQKPKKETSDDSSDTNSQAAAGA